eukprot:TRINITY_DN1004_c0_g1::TRINITY_DN1004_c0_g1_i1::g.29951::m.29951 TRINITY_DN1004_c0_g1::TRINITY_DN1004_c0_g1_i1::g.29951  ORF type:complete len:772 (+),score=265.22,sp/Q54K32/RGAA_DICDI/31.56/3e-98,RasGAP/PF00616.14/3.5e+03,RasGAP/PF00616.14/4.8e-45,RasGAP/PF00616.14/3.7e+03,RasGAP_C/PF03836.10/5.8e+03,RasGAP_C/PF03836.10/3.6e+02,RasGAP_C/PF03836.10/5.7e-12,IncA/PF04156.9/0.004,IncA/PF04156.9/2.1e+03,IncA/PF04156.9/66,Snapin_Pallidin/PF14712.1/1.5e+03,Snapin_Pallidin/PF14712.1/1.5e+03,Snapin_Palli
MAESDDLVADGIEGISIADEPAEARDISLYALQQKAKSLSSDFEAQIDKEQREINDLKQRIVIESKEDYILEQQAKELDSKIHLLIKNRLTLQEIMEPGSDSKEPKASSSDPRHIMQSKREVYEHLFHYLQTQPQYLAHLTRIATPGEVSQLLQTIIFTLYADQFDAREEHLLLRLFQIVLQAEFDACDELSTFMRGNTGVTQMLCAYTRRGPGHATLKKTLTPSLTALSKIPNLNLEINPSKVYQAMINEIEMKTGKNSDLPRNVTNDEAAANKQVQQIIQGRIAQLHALGNDIFNRIVSCMDEMPYGLRWIGKQLRLMAKIKFPLANKYKIGSLVGGFIYLRFFNPAIVSPESLNLLDSKPSPVMRRNLILIAKLLQNLSNGVQFGGKEDYMAPLNRFIVENKDKLQDYFDRLTDVADLDHHLQVDQYLARINTQEKSINITFNEVVLVSELLGKYRDNVCPETSLLREMLSEVGPAPERLPRKDDFSINVRLVPHSKIKQPEGFDSKLDLQLYASTQSLLVSVLRQLPEIPQETTLKLLEILHNGGEHASSDGLKAQISEIVKQLEALAKKQDSTKYNPDKTDPYEPVMIDLADYLEERQRQKSVLALEIETLKNVLQNIRGNHEVIVSKVQAYKEYLANIRAQNFKPGGSKDKKEKKTKDKKGKDDDAESSFVISHPDLEKLGVIHQSKVPAEVRKNVKFTFTSSQSGVIDVSACYRGINVTKFILQFEELLERQHDGEEHLIFEEVTLNINLLIHLINDKLIMHGE